MDYKKFIDVILDSLEKQRRDIYELQKVHKELYENVLRGRRIMLSDDNKLNKIEDRLNKIEEEIKVFKLKTKWKKILE